MENDITAKLYGEILAEGMTLAEVNLEDKIESEALLRLKKIDEIISSNNNDTQKLEQVRNILTTLG